MCFKQFCPFVYIGAADQFAQMGAAKNIVNVVQKAKGRFNFHAFQQ